MSRTVKPQHAALLLEGRKDNKIFSNFIDWDKCAPYVLSGRDNVLEALALARANQVPGVVAIVDRDSDHIYNRRIDDPCVAVTDKRDLEGMLIASPALEKVFGEHEVRPTFDLRQTIANGACHLGYMRALCHANGWHVDFKRIRYNSFFDPRTGVVSNNLVASTVLGSAENVGFGRSPLEIDELIRGISDASHDPLLVSQGHDMAAVAAEILKFYTGRRDITARDMESFLRLAFETEHFRTTSLFAALCEWQETNKNFIVLKLGCPVIRT
ncbi:DUF4435 domain-containing protein [Terriglobus tenax]|uniref:DUF4435 domain-containing protein n=1 Tax=Terriglobus tenax TaxID=1111115 RepID=UPI0021E01761|nr:DUF4435 domain-containing protein [Terriglobus tenax]